MDLELAATENIEEIFPMYVQAIKRMNNSGMYQWDKTYPSYNHIAKDIEKKELYIGKVENKIAVAVAINKDFDKEYGDVDWADASGNFVVAHRLCVNTELQNMGIARKTMQGIESKVFSMGVSSIRLDCFSKNSNAIKLYNSLGYETLGEIDWKKGKFIVMEKVLKQ